MRQTSITIYYLALGQRKCYLKLIRGVTYLFVKLHEGWLKEGAVIFNMVVGVLLMTQTFAHVILWLEEVSLNLSREGMEWNNYVSGVSNLFQFDV